MSPSHIAANLATYLTFAPELVKMTGRAGFAHAYLLSALTSQLFVCCWHKWAPADKRVRGENGEIEGLGASGAISGISVAYLLALSRQKQRSGTVLFRIRGRDVKPIELLTMHVLGDLSGLTGGGGVIEFAHAFAQKKAGIKDDDKDDKKNIAFDMHVGGAVGGAFFWAVWQVLGKGGIKMMLSNTYCIVLCICTALILADYDFF
jgi:membrane associated rhomboid family serine protease